MNDPNPYLFKEIEYLTNGMMKQPWLIPIKEGELQKGDLIFVNLPADAWKGNGGIWDHVMTFAGEDALNFIGNDIREANSNLITTRADAAGNMGDPRFTTNGKGGVTGLKNFELYKEGMPEGTEYRFYRIDWDKLFKMYDPNYPSNK